MKDELLDKFRELISNLVFERNWSWLEYIISLLATMEVELPLILDNDFRYDLNTSDSRRISPPPEELETYAQRVIPKHTLYCQGCPFYACSKIARFFYGNQCDGYCYYKGKGDFSFVRPTELLWDGCKECGINEDFLDWEDIKDEGNDNL